MASKLEKAQIEYERLLRELGSRAEMVGLFDRADPTLLKNHGKAIEALADRKTELDFLDSEIEQLQADHVGRREQLQQQIASLTEEIDASSKVIEVKKGKAGPLKTKLAGMEYDLKFVEKSLADEQRKGSGARAREDFERAKIHDENLKRLKIEVLKRRKALNDIQRQIREYENPAAKIDKEIEEKKIRLDEVKKDLAAMKGKSRDETLVELKRQRSDKQKEIARSEQHLLDIQADVGEDLYEKRLSHPVLNKYYADLDQIAAEIDSLQGD